jgi:hypothetical protein
VVAGDGTLPNVNVRNIESNSAMRALLGFVCGAIPDGGISMAPKFESVSEDVLTGISPKACAFQVSLLPRRFARLPHEPDHETTQSLRARFP